MPGVNLLQFVEASTIIDGTSDMAIDGTTNVTASIPRLARGAVVTVSGSGIRWKLDGNACSTGSGHYQAAGSVITFDSWTAPGGDWNQALKNFRFCPSSSGTCSIAVSLFD